MKKLCPLISIAWLFFSLNTKAQSGGKSAYSFLNLVNPARVASLGGSMVAVKDNDLNLAYINPSLLNPSMNGQISMSGVDYFSGVSYGNALYAKNFKKKSTFSTGITYINYGHIAETESNGEETGRTYYASDFAISIAWGKGLNKLSKYGLSSRWDSVFSVGADVKFIYSNIADYTSAGIVFDGGLTYHNTKKHLTSSLLIKNAGTQLKPYYSKHRESIKPEIQAAVSKKFLKAPIRFCLALHHLEKFNITYFDSADAANRAALNGSTVIEAPSFPEKLFHHVVLGMEFEFSKSFSLRTAYNFHRRTELGVDSRMALAGFSWGFGFRVSKFFFSYGNAIYSTAGATNHFTMAFSMPDFVSRKRYYYQEGK